MKRLFAPLVFLFVSPQVPAADEKVDADKNGLKSPEIRTSRKSFKMSVLIDAKDRRKIAEVLLYLSRDKGKTWKKAQSAPSDVRYFDYKADVEGSYWFAVQCLHVDGKKVPIKVTEPGLRVLVESNDDAPSEGGKVEENELPMLRVSTAEETVPKDCGVIKQRTFYLPVKIDDEVRGKLKEVILYVSRDRGKKWKIAAKREPDAIYFIYQAPADGRYFFAVQTIAKDGTRVPNKIEIQDAIQVRVDTSGDGAPPRD
jgi:hypothetical protein